MLEKSYNKVYNNKWRTASAFSVPETEVKNELYGGVPYVGNVA